MADRPALSNSSEWGVLSLLMSSLSILSAGVLLAVLAASVSPLLLDSGLSEDTAAVSVDGSRGAVRQLQFAADGRHVHVLRHPTVWQRIDIHTGKVHFQQLLSPEFLCAVYPVQSDQQTMVYLDHQRCGLLSLTDSQRHEDLSAALGPCNRVAACELNPHVAMFNADSLQLCSTDNGLIVARQEIDGGIAAIQWCPDGTSLFLLTRNGELQQRHSTTLEVLRSKACGIVGEGRILVSSSGQHVAAYDQAGTAVTWNLSTNDIERHRTGTYAIQTIEMTPNGDYLIVPDAYRDVWLIPTTGDNRQRRYLGTAAANVSALCLVDGGESLLVGTFTGQLESWSMLTAQRNWISQDDTPMKERPAIVTEPARRFAQRAASCASTRS